MNRKLLFSVAASVLITAGVYAQKESKTYTETFTIGDNAVLDINTSNADIEFETWDKNQVEINATIELIGATPEEAAHYFKEAGISIKGNSKEINITTKGENSWLLKNGHNGLINSHINFDLEPLFQDLRFSEVQLPELSEELLELTHELSELVELEVIPELPIIPSLPQMPNVSFDYEAYKKNGDKYLKKWRKQFEKSFDEDFKKNFEAWGKEFEKLNEERLAQLGEARKLAYEKRREKLLQEREIREKARKVIREKTQQKKEFKRKQYEQRKAELLARRDSQYIRRDTIRFNFLDSIQSSRPNIFYLSSDKESKRYKVKKTIKVKMPKSVKLKMNVRHGEVKLASTTKNLDASLQYASLLAYTIDGAATNIRVAYSPVTVQKWNYGQLKTDYSDKVSLKEVGELRLNSVSSKVVIDKLNKSVLLTNNLGEVLINSVATNFKDIDASIKNGEFTCKVPKTPVSFYLNSTKSKMVYPSQWNIERTKNFDNIVYKGYQSNANTNKNIRVDATYSEVTLEN